MSDATKQYRALLDRLEVDDAEQAAAMVLLELAETVQRLSMWEVEYVAVKDRRQFDPQQLAREIAAAMPQAKVRKLKVAKVRTMPMTMQVPGWGYLDLPRAAQVIARLREQIGDVRGQRDSMREERNEALRANVELLAERDQSAVAFGNLQRDLAALRHALNDSNDDRHRMRQLLDDGRLAVDKAHQAVKTVLEGDQ